MKLLINIFGNVQESEWPGLKNFKYYDDVLGYL
jgi:hypothetical protein